MSEAVILMTGTWRISFNRHGAAPRVWSIMQDDPGMRWELAVSHLRITAPCWTRYEPKATADDDDGLPSAWIGVTGMLRVLADGTATIG